MKPATPDYLKKYLGKRVHIALRGNRDVTGVLSGYDVFVNVTLSDAKERDGQKWESMGREHTIVRGNSISVIELVESGR